MEKNEPSNFSHNVGCVLIIVLVVAILVSFGIATYETLQNSEDDSEIQEGSDATVAENEIELSMTSLCYVYNGDSRMALGRLMVDNTTNIVYFSKTAGKYSSGITPYLAPNGQPYTYDAETNTLIPLPAYQDEEVPDEWIIRLDNIVGGLID